MPDAISQHVPKPGTRWATEQSADATRPVPRPTPKTGRGRAEKAAANRR